MANSEQCTVCYAGPETCDHIFRQCTLAKAFWNSRQFPRAFLQSFQNSYQNWIDTNLATTDLWQGIQWRYVFATILWGLWRLRCQVVFGNHKQSGNYFMNQCLTFLSDWLAVRVRLGSNTAVFKPASSWTMPTSGWFKANVDAGLLSNGFCSIGGLIRKDNGDWCIGFQQLTQSKSILESELRSIYTMLGLILQFSYLPIILETDSAIAAMLLSQNASYQHPLRPLLQAYHQRLLELPNTQVKYVSRDQNSAAHLLCSLAKSLPDQFLHVLFHPPDTCTNMLNAEAMLCTM